MDDLIRLLGNMLGGSATRLFRDELPNGIIVSTVNTPDCGLETAILDSVKTYPVEQYGSEDEARLGHENWCRIAADLKNGSTIIQLGYGEILPPKEVIIRL